MYRPTFKRLAVLAVIVGAVLTSPACDDEHAHEGEDHLAELIAEACLHFDSGPMSTVVASAAVADAPVVASVEHMRLDITLAADPNGGYKGYFAVDLDEAGEFILVATQAATLAVSTDAAQTPLAFEPVTYDGTCGGTLQAFDGTVGRHTFELSANTEFVSIVMEHAGDEHEHDH